MRGRTSVWNEREGGSEEFGGDSYFTGTLTPKLIKTWMFQGTFGCVKDKPQQKAQRWLTSKWQFPGSLCCFIFNFAVTMCKDIVSTFLFGWGAAFCLWPDVKVIIIKSAICDQRLCSPWNTLKVRQRTGKAFVGGLARCGYSEEESLTSWLRWHGFSPQNQVHHEKQSSTTCNSWKPLSHQTFAVLLFLPVGQPHTGPALVFRYGKHPKTTYPGKLVTDSRLFDVSISDVWVSQSPNHPFLWSRWNVSVTCRLRFRTKLIPRSEERQIPTWLETRNRFRFHTQLRGFRVVVLLPTQSQPATQRTPTIMNQGMWNELGSGKGPGDWAWLILHTSGLMMQSSLFHHSPRVPNSLRALLFPRPD